MKIRPAFGLLETVLSITLMASIAVSMLTISGGALAMQADYRDTVVAGNLALQRRQELSQADYSSLASQPVTAVTGTPYSIEVVVSGEIDNGAGNWEKHILINVYRTGKPAPVQQVLQSRGRLASISVIPHGKILFDTPGDYTWTVPAGVATIWISGAGGGGGGACGSASYSGGGGGGAASTIAKAFAVTPGASINLHVGTGGAGGLPGCSGISASTDGADTVMPGYLTLAGGRGGSYTTDGTYSALSGAPGGAGGGWGGRYVPYTAGQKSTAPKGRDNYGGGTLFGAGGGPDDPPYNNGAAYGAGGAGGRFSGKGGDGAAGMILIEW